MKKKEMKKELYDEIEEILADRDEEKKRRRKLRRTKLEKATRYMEEINREEVRRRKEQERKINIENKNEPKGITNDFRKP